MKLKYFHRSIFLFALLSLEIPGSTAARKTEPAGRYKFYTNPSVKVHYLLFKRSLPNEELRKNLIVKIRSLPINKLNRYKIEAARHLQNNLVQAFQVLSTNGEKVPERIRVASRRALIATQNGKFTPVIANNLGIILKQTSRHSRHPAEQFRSVLTTIIPHVPPGTRVPLQGILGFVSSSLASVNTLLGRLLGEVPDLLAGVITSLTNSLGAVTGAATGTLASLGTLLGGVIG